MVKKVKVSISIDKRLLADLDKTIETYSLANRSVLIEKWTKIGFKKLKEEHGIPVKQEIAPEISRPD